MDAPGVESRTVDLETPRLFGHGEEDPLLPASRSERTAERTGGELELLAECGHWPTRDEPKRFNAAVAAFLRT